MGSLLGGLLLLWGLRDGRAVARLTPASQGRMWTPHARGNLADKH